MADPVDPKGFRNAIQAIAGPFRPDALALTVARMLVAVRSWPKSRDGVPGFLDQSRELTRADWLAIVGMLAKDWKGGRGQTDNPFTKTAEQAPRTPGTLEQLRQLVLASLSREGETLSVPFWLLESVLDLTERRGLFTQGPDPALRAFIIDAVAATPKTHVFCAYDNAAGIALGLAAAGAEVTFDVEQQDLVTLCTCLALAAALPLHVRCGDPLKLARDDLNARSLLPDDGYDISVVFPPFGMRQPPEGGDALETNLPLPASIEAAGVTLALNRGQKMALCVLSPSFLFRATKADQLFKERAIRDFGLETIVGLPRGVFGGTSLAAGLLIFKPDQRSGRPQRRKAGNVFMIDARDAWDRSGTRANLPKLLRAREDTDIGDDIRR